VYVAEGLKSLIQHEFCIVIAFNTIDHTMQKGFIFSGITHRNPKGILQQGK
jgi:hypothetical protein